MSEQDTAPTTASAPAPQFSGPFREGDRVQLTGPKGKLNSITLEAGKVFHTHRGAIEHDALIGLPDGSVVQNTVGDLQEALPSVHPDGTVDRVVLDMLAPWECVDVVADALKPG